MNCRFSGRPSVVLVEGFPPRTERSVGMALPEVVSRDVWLAARRSLLEREKESRRLQDRINAERRRLPMVRIDKAYRFRGAGGEVGLAALFAGRPQLIVQHVM